MKRKIKEIAYIQTGLFARPAGKGELVYLQAKHFDEYGQLQKDLYPDLLTDNISDKHLLKEGDVLFAAKGTKNFAVVFENHNAPSVASTSFFVIRVTDKRLLPQYLAWVLNSPEIQSLLKAQAIGTSIPSISKQVLEKLLITVPDIEIQKAVLLITKLRNREKDLRQRIETLKDLKINQQLFQAMNDE